VTNSFRAISRLLYPSAASGAVAEVVVGEREAGPDAERAVFELVQPARLVRQPVGQLPDRPVRTRRQAGARDPQRERQLAAERGQAGRRVALGPHPAVTGDAGEQVDRLLRLEHVDLDVHDAGQATEPAPAGDQHRAVRTAGQHRKHLVLARHVVEYHQDPAVGEQCAIGLGPFRQTVRHRPAGHAERPQEPLEDLRRAGAVRVEPEAPGDHLERAEHTEIHRCDPIRQPL
jgi:hypothetical protein